MGKYINRNSKTPTEVPSSYGGVRTRAKTLALQKAAGGGSSYIQLRSRRLVKLTATKRQKENKINLDDSGKKLGELKDGEKIKVCENDDEEGSIGENIPEIEAKGRSTRETTPCNLIRDPDTITTPGSSTKWAYSSNVNNRVQNSPPSPIRLTVEMEEFFTEPEKQQQKLFIEKYNFDPVNDKPLRGRYEWVKVDDNKNVN